MSNDHRQRPRSHNQISALRQIAGINIPPQQMPSYSITSSARENRGHLEAERLGGLQIDDQVKSGWSLDGQFGYLGAFEDWIDVGCRSLIKIRPILGRRPSARQTLGTE